MLVLALVARGDDEDTLAAARAEMREGRLGKALEMAQPLADKGDARAQFLVGDVYWDGRGIGRDRAQAARWYELAAKQGHTGAMVRLAEAYRAGDGVKADARTSTEWCRKAADAGDGRGLGMLGVAYLQGLGVEKDDARARDYLEKGAAKKDGYSFFWLASMEKKPASAHALYERAGEHGYAPAYTRLGDLHRAKDAAKAFAYYHRAAEASDPVGQRQLGLCFLEGVGVKADSVRARTWLRRAAASEDKAAIAKLRELSRPIFGRIVSSEVIDQRWTEIEIDKGEMDGVRLRQRGRIPGVSARFEITKVLPKRSYAKVRAFLTVVRNARQVVTIER
jgi:TPR repeat protein